MQATVPNMYIDIKFQIVVRYGGGTKAIVLGDRLKVDGCCGYKDKTEGHLLVKMRQQNSNRNVRTNSLIELDDGKEIITVMGIRENLIDMYQYI